ncbi:hypothetical protein [Caldimonas taiwanensis]|uniref:hypothetical protein n=1 Tax=Caldimonas taiwanensis TaxID=307483 RepID=UPI0007836D52|nr:hypothetical protein [Caldimonas taiwanensis]
MARPALLPPTVKRRLTIATLASLATPWLIGAWIKSGMQPGLHDEAHRAAQLVDYIVAGSTIFLCAMILTVAVGCVVVSVMRGPHYLGDPFPNERSDGS